MGYITTKYWLSFTLIVLLVSIYAEGCTAHVPMGPPPEALTIAFSADTRAELYKCG
jgi:hypothetical protein